MTPRKTSPHQNHAANRENPVGQKFSNLYISPPVSPHFESSTDSIAEAWMVHFLPIKIYHFYQSKSHERDDRNNSRFTECRRHNLPAEWPYLLWVRARPHVRSLTIVRIWVRATHGRRKASHPGLGRLPGRWEYSPGGLWGSDGPGSRVLRGATFMEPQGVGLAISPALVLKPPARHRGGGTKCSGKRAPRSR